MKRVSLLCIWILSITFWVELDVFGQQVIQEIPPGGIVISAPGTYVFANDITWTPTGNTVFAITIHANNVILDMRGFTLSTTTRFRTFGVLALSCTDLQIINGTFLNMGSVGIILDLCTNVTIKDVVIDGLTVNDIVDVVQAGGIASTACTNVSIDKCTFKNFNVTAASTSGIELGTTTGVSITNCLIENLLNQDGGCGGIGLGNCQDIFIKSCKIDRIRAEFVTNINTSGHTAIGILPQSSSNIKIEKCDISNITGCCNDAHGLSLFNSSNAIVKKCRVWNVLDGVGLAQTGTKATGIEVYASDAVVEDCSVKNIVGINPERQAAGFSVAKANNVQFIRCKAKKVKAISATGEPLPLITSNGFPSSVGFGWAPDPRELNPATNVLYLNCVAAHCKIGFDTWDHVNSVWDHIVSKCNEIAILVQENGQRTISCGPCSECGCTGPGCLPTPITVTFNNQAANNTFEHVKKIKCHRRASHSSSSSSSH